jgi:predicted enzyme related to lactoylglutathione lyase
MSDATVRGRFVWHELLTTDTAAASGFYQGVIGWKPQAWPQDPSYTMFVAETGPMAGLMTLPGDALKRGEHPHWISYVGTPDVDATVRQALEMGGTILHVPTEIPNVGRFAVIQDPQGAVLSAFTPVEGPMDADSVPPGGFSWHELITTDRPAAFSFYARLFGWVKTEVVGMGQGLGMHQMFGLPGRTLGGMYSNRHVPGPPHWLAYAMVPDTDEAANQVAKLGGRVLHGPMVVPGGDCIAQCSDPQGAMFALHSGRPAVPELMVDRPLPRNVVQTLSTPKPAAKMPVARKPATKKAVTKPSAPKPAARKSTVKKAAVKKTAVKKATVKKVTVKKATARKQAVKKPAAKKPLAKKPVAPKVAKKTRPARKSVLSKPAAAVRAQGRNR